jgi:hypothetical protein
MTEIVHVIQLAVAPVFLISGVAGILTVMTNRLARIIDRGRVLAAMKDLPPDEAEAVADEQAVLARRGQVVNVAIWFCTITGVFVAVVIMMLFVTVFFGFDATAVVALLFILGMLCFSISLICFLREITLATHATRFDVTGASKPRPPAKP